MLIKIKEILDFKEDADYKRLSIEDILLLKECITNLQEDLKYQKEMYDEYCDKHTKLMQEYSNLKKENEILNKGIEYAKRIEKNYKTRFDKAIEYINLYEYTRYCPSPYEKEKYIMREEKEGQDLLNILKGSDK